MTVKRTAAGAYVGLACDTCDTLAPGTAEILAGHGLTNMGWYCSGGTHICPSCPHPVVPTRARPALLPRNSVQL